MVSTVHLAEAFADNFGLMFTTAITLSNVSMVIMPLLLDYWLQTHGLQSAVALLGALTWNCIPCGLLFKTSSPRSWKRISNGNRGLDINDKVENESSEQQRHR